MTSKIKKAVIILRKAGCSEIYLFGSQATGRAFEVLKQVGELKKIG